MVDPAIGASRGKQIFITEPPCGLGNRNILLRTSWLHFFHPFKSLLGQVCFLLIIFFVVTASFDREQIDSKIDLPTVDFAAVKSLPEQRIMVNILENGSVKIGFTELQQNEVPAKLGGLLKAHQATSDTVVIISGDRNTRYKYISPVMNAAAQAGFSQVRTA